MTAFISSLYQMGLNDARDVPNEHPFTSAFSLPNSDQPYSLQEIRIAKWSYFIRSTKQEWERKVRQPEIRAKWKQEILDHERTSVPFEDDDLSAEARDARFTTLDEVMVDYILDELQLHASLSNPEGIRASCFDKIFESDTIISSELLSQLSKAVSKLEDVPDDRKDWHPKSNNQVLDLVHPSLYPLQYGKTFISTTSSSTASTNIEVATVHPVKPWQEENVSKKYQWLPTDFDISDTGAVTIDGYINNLHPSFHSDLYPIISKVFESFVPLFDRVLSELQQPPKRRIYVDCNWYPEEFDWDKSWSDENKAYSDFEENRKIEVPSPGKFEMPPPKEGLCYTLKGRKVQVIVKLANIVLTPENPSYGGGSWHVEGMMNEDIVASGIYYYDQENIGESRLAFRGTFNDEDVEYQQSDDRGCKIVYGIENDSPCFQLYNSLETSHHRCIAFPNIYQHQVSPFSLLDPSKPGHRKILCFFLVNPQNKIPSTKTVAPQQRSWISKEVALIDEKSSLPRLPPEIWELILDEAGFLTMEEAKLVREDLMEERSMFVVRNGEEVFERPFSLCEH